MSVLRQSFVQTYCVKSPGLCIVLHANHCLCNLFVTKTMNLLLLIKLLNFCTSYFTLPFDHFFALFVILVFASMDILIWLNKLDYCEQYVENKRNNKEGLHQKVFLPWNLYNSIFGFES